MSLAVIKFDEDYVPNLNPKGSTPLKTFWKVRSSLLLASREHGTTGPYYPEDGPEPDSLSYYLVDDQYNDELYQRMEVCEPEGWNAEWLLSLAECLRKHKGWGICISSFETGYVVLFGGRILVKGTAFADCTDLPSVVDAAKRACEEFYERKYGPVSRQLEYLKHLIPDAIPIVRKKHFQLLAAFDKYELYDGYALWILQTKPYHELMLDVENSPIEDRAVDDQGAFIPRKLNDPFSIETIRSARFWLVAYLVKDRSRREFRLLENEKEIGRIEVDRIITDEEVKQMLKPT